MTDLARPRVQLMAARRLARLTQAGLAQAAGVSLATIGQLERGECLSPGYDVVARIVRALNGRLVENREAPITAEDLFGSLVETA